ncbi:spermidine synthase [Plasmopara halstedii]|uniref:thermospermine synthase n=1 Tax=Plasmopara halstedii TaxID=4781 RepID=A0A0P1AJP4_PLAHL|nr:spermidine synthase [Plasmopara halstedii]CEG41569.1 spermidine synthase [Plasmopara halstedii]|eukprot:XP_024577938.1 spermidine synthase [Plasmopara halstedii]
MAEVEKEAIATEQTQLAAYTKPFVYKEVMTEDLLLSIALKTITFEAKSKFQSMQIIETYSFGKTLVLDGKTQSAKLDEAIYHETLVHPAMLAHKNPKTVFIGGGGEFATAREVLKHKSVEKVVMVDIDELVCNMCRKEMPEWADGAFEDPRLEVHYTDAHAFLKQYNGTFDVIIMDIADPIEAGPGYVLYTEEFYEYANTKLNKGGYIVTQSGPGAVYNYDECFTSIYCTLKTNFNSVVPYTVEIPSFGCAWAFNMATNVEDENGGEATVKAIRERSIDETNALVESRIKKPLHFYDGVSHLGLFGLPKMVREALEKETRVITQIHPFMTQKRFCTSSI